MIPTTPDPAFLKQRVALFAELEDARLAAVIDGSRVELFQAGDFIVRAGSDATALGVVLEGGVDACTTDAAGEMQVFGTFGPGDTFGELALTSGEPAHLDLVASGPCRVMMVPLTLFQTQIMASPNALRHVSKTIGERYQRLLANPAGIAAMAHREEAAAALELRSERPERILVLNCGSTSLKYALFDTARPDATLHGQVERIGIPGTRITQRGPRGTLTRDLPSAGLEQALEATAACLLDQEAGGIADLADITAVGHRVVHGGEKFSAPALIDEAALAAIDALSPLAPLHNPANVQGIRAARKALPAVPHVAVFDTAFHATLPSHAYLYGLPYGIYEKHRVRRYGFHGTSHHYVSLAAAKFLHKRPRELKVISCHLGGGASVCAIDHGRSVDTSMGFTPNEGLIMGTRCGDLDAGVLAFLHHAEGLDADGIERLLNKESGMLGLSGISSDMREISEAAEAGDARALTAMKAYCYRLRKYIGAYVAAMGGLDVLVFTAGVGQGSAGVRASALQGLGRMGIHLDERLNREASGKRETVRISTDDSPVTVLVIPTDEELMIARETLHTLNREQIRVQSAVSRNEPILVEVSAHHIHLTQDHVEALFGPGHQLTRHSDLSQPGQYACKEQLAIVGPKGRIERVRVLGPVRRATQVEIAMTEQYKLGIEPPIRESGDIAGTPGCTLEGPVGRITIDRGVICALRHIHMTPEDALRYGVRDKCTVRVRIEGDRELIFGDVRVRVDPNFALAMHIDTDEANAANLQTGARGYIDGIQAD